MNRIRADYQPQVWVFDNAVDCDFAREVDVTAKVLALNLDAIHQLKDNTGATDELVSPAERRHDGPGYVRVCEEVCSFFDVTELAEITQEMLDEARKALKAEPVPELPVPITLYVRASADGENLSPGVAAVVLDDEFLEEVERLRGVARKSGLSYASIWCSPEQWGSGSDAEGYGWGMQVCQLHVSENGWHFDGSPKHSDYYVGTASVSHERTRQLIEEARAAGRSYALYECDEAELIEEGILPDPDGEADTEEEATA